MASSHVGRSMSIDRSRSAPPSRTGRDVADAYAQVRFDLCELARVWRQPTSQPSRVPSAESFRNEPRPLSTFWFKRKTAHLRKGRSSQAFVRGD